VKFKDTGWTRSGLWGRRSSSSAPKSHLRAFEPRYHWLHGGESEPWPGIVGYQPSNTIGHILMTYLTATLRLARHCQAPARGCSGVSPGSQSIILCTFAYKFISKLYCLNKIAASIPPLCRAGYHRKPTHPISVLIYRLPLSLRPFCTLISINTMCKCFF
jgi:hypothetical protein